jgi:hypothetical protein
MMSHAAALLRESSALQKATFIAQSACFLVCALRLLILFASQLTVWQSTVYVVQRIIYNLYFHPLAKYPGPLLARCSQLWTVRNMLAGRQAFEVYKLHRKYGPVVRIAPSELVFESAEAWKDIYGIRPGRAEIPKDPIFYLNSAAGAESIIAAPAKQHSVLRRLLSHGFSERALREQVDIIQDYVDLLIARMRAESEKEPRSDMVKWYNVSHYGIPPARFNRLTNVYSVLHIRCDRLPGLC